jgi:hypothetical protein
MSPFISFITSSHFQLPITSHLHSAILHSSSTVFPLPQSYPFIAYIFLLPLRTFLYCPTPSKFFTSSSLHIAHCLLSSVALFIYSFFNGTPLTTQLRATRRWGLGRRPFCFNKDVTAKIVQCCRKPKPREAYTLYVLPLASAWGRTVHFYLHVAYYLLISTRSCPALSVSKYNL